MLGYSWPASCRERPRPATANFWKMRSFASTTTSSLTRPRTCNTSRGSVGRGSRSTGDTTAGWWPAPRRVRRPPRPASPRLRPRMGEGRTFQAARCSRKLYHRVPLTADQEFQSGLTCNGKPAAPSPLGPALATCSAAGLGSIYLKIPAPGIRVPCLNAHPPAGSLPHNHPPAENRSRSLGWPV